MGQNDRLVVTQRLGWDLPRRIASSGPHPAGGPIGAEQARRTDNNKSMRLQRRTGFTLVELLIVVTILSIAAAIVVPMASSAGSMQIRAAVNMVAADLEYAKSMAISRGQNYSVVFDKVNETYQIEDSNGDVIEHPVNVGTTYVVSFGPGSRFDHVEIEDVDFDLTSEVVFDYLGSPHNGTGNPLNAGAVTLQAGDVTRAVNVEPVTGFISVSE